MFQTRSKYSKHVSYVSNALLMLKTRFKCFKRIADIQNTLRMLAPPCIRNALLIPEKNTMRQVCCRKLREFIKIKADMVYG